MTDTEQANDKPGRLIGRSPRRRSRMPSDLRPERPRVTRLSRKVLIAGARLWLLDPHFRCRFLGLAKQARSERPARKNSTQPIITTSLTVLAGYQRTMLEFPADVPRLGPPLPGDLGRPIVAAQNQSGPLAVDAEQQRVNQETEAARTSKVFATTHCPAISRRRRRPMKHQQMRHHRRTRRSLRMARIANLRSSMRRSIDEPQVPTAWQSRLRPSWFRPGQSFRPLSSPEFGPICQAKSPRR